MLLYLLGGAPRVALGVERLAGACDRPAPAADQLPVIASVVVLIDEKLRPGRSLSGNAACGGHANRLSALLNAGGPSEARRATGSPSSHTSLSVSLRRPDPRNRALVSKTTTSAANADS